MRACVSGAVCWCVKPVYFTSDAVHSLTAVCLSDFHLYAITLYGVNINGEKVEHCPSSTAVFLFEYTHTYMLVETIMWESNQLFVNVAFMEKHCALSVSVPFSRLYGKICVTTQIRSAFVNFPLSKFDSTRYTISICTPHTNTWARARARSGAWDQCVNKRLARLFEIVLFLHTHWM